jgi:curli biogenesis system outer membrane secretion channel CsgG
MEAGKFIESCGMKKRGLLLSVLTILFVFSLSLCAGDSYEGMEFGDLKKAKKDINSKCIMVKAGLGELGSGSFKLKDQAIGAAGYTAVKLYRPGKTSESFNAYLPKDSSVMQTYQGYGTGARLKKTWEKDRGVSVCGTVYHTGGWDYPVSIVIDRIEPTKDKPKGNLRYSITVVDFENKANWQGQWNIGDGFTEIMTNALQESAWFIVLGDKQMRFEALQEQDLGDSGRVAKGKKTPKIGRMTPAQLLVKGAITHVQQSTTGGSGGINIQGIQIGGSKDHAEINITIYLVDSETGQVKASTKVVGKSKRKGGRLGYFGGGLGGLTGGLSGFKKDNVGKACEDAVSQAVEFLIEQLEDIPWEGTISLVKADKILINRGEREGVQVGQRFNVGSVEELVDEDTGEVLDVEMTQVGILEVIRVKEKVAYCKAIEGGEEIQKGMSIQPME